MGVTVEVAPDRTETPRHPGPTIPGPGTAGHPSRSGRARGLLTVGTGALLAGVFLAVRYRLALTPTLAETYYDEALTGLMAFAILQGIPQVFYWGEPYGGAIGDAYPAAIGFWLFGPSTLVLRMASVVIAVLGGWSVWFIARRTAGERFALVAGLATAVPPVFVSFAQLSTHGESTALALGTLALASAAYLVAPGGRRGRALAWMILGLAAGLSWWSSQIGAMLLLAAALGLVVARPEVLRGPGPYAALALFLLASLPFWVWNARHDWATFRHLATWGDTLPPWHIRLQMVGGALLASLRGSFWEARAVRLPSWAQTLGWITVWTVYLPGVLVAVTRGLTWVGRLRRQERPWRDPLDLVVVAFWVTVAAHLLTWFGTSGVLRYSLTFHAILPVLLAVALARLAAAGWAVGAGALAAALLVFNTITHVVFVREGESVPWRPVDAAVARLEALGIRACYTDHRIAQVVTFESGARILCTDYLGYRNYDFLHAVDRVDDPTTVALVAHRALQAPHPDAVTEGLGLIGARYQREQVGDYAIFHGFVSPGPTRPIPSAGWVARASAGSEAAELAFDRRAWTRWTAPIQAGQWLEVDLGRPYPVAQVTLAAAPWASEAPSGLLVETSVDGRTWRTAASAREVWPGLHWWKGHPRADDGGRVIVRMDPHPTRYVRVAETRKGGPGWRWGIAELFVHEAAATPWEPPPGAREAVAAAERELDRWMDDPSGSHPSRAPVTYEHRRNQVRWSTVFAEANRALALAPEWEEAHHLYGLALARAGWSGRSDVDIERAAKDQTWTEVVRWAEQADAIPEGLWRRGRLGRWAEGLDRLGQADAARVLRGRPAPAPAHATRTSFGEELDLVGLDLPGEARPGDTVTVRYHWRLARPVRHDYWVFLHVRGLKDARNQDQPVGGGVFGTSHWSPGEEVRQSVTFHVSPETPPGVYPLHVGVWLPWTGKQLRASTADLAIVRRAVVIGSLTVSR